MEYQEIDPRAELRTSIIALDQAQYTRGPQQRNEQVSAHAALVVDLLQKLHTEDINRRETPIIATLPAIRPDDLRTQLDLHNYESAFGAAIVAAAEAQNLRVMVETPRGSFESTQEPTPSSLSIAGLKKRFFGNNHTAQEPDFRLRLFRVFDKSTPFAPDGRGGTQYARYLEELSVEFESQK